MRKILALYINEMLKISKKISVLVILAIMTVGIIGYGSLIKLTTTMMPGSQDYNNINGGSEFDGMRQEIDSLKNEIKSLETQIAATNDEMLRFQYEEQKNSMTERIALLQLALDKQIPIYSNTDYRAQALSDAVKIRSDLRSLLQIAEADRTAAEKDQIVQYTNLAARLETLAGQNDFRAYLDIRNAQVAADPNLSAAEKQIAKENNEIWYKADPSGGLDGRLNATSVMSALSQIEIMKKSLLDNQDYTNYQNYGFPLTPKSSSKITNDLAVLVYRLENGLSIGYESMDMGELANQGMLGFGLFMIVMLMMILAGGAVSQEIATGSIKSLIVSPAKRWKIFMAKVLSLLSVGLVSAIYLYLLAMLVQGLLFGFSAGSPYVFAVNGMAGEISFYIFKLGFLLANFIDVIVYMILALMLSVMTRNTAASVGIAVGVYFAGSIFNSFLAVITTLSPVGGEWLKFIPFSNLGLASEFFPFDIYSNLLGSMTGTGVSASSPSILFSLVYLAVLVLCMGYTALDSFNRRDIK